MIAFDTDVLTGILMGRAALVERAAQVPADKQAVPIIVIEEIMRGRLNVIRRAEAGRDKTAIDRAYGLFERTFTDLRRIRVLSYTAEAESVYQDWRSQGLRGSTHDLRRDRDVAAALGQIAEILAAQQRYAEADARYGEALRVARAAGDLGLQGVLLQHQATLQLRIGSPGRAVKLGKDALTRFQQAGNSGAEMEACDLLGSAEKNLGHLDAAEAWYARSRELAETLEDQDMLAVIAQNVGILHQRRAEQTDDPQARTGHLHRAVASIEESLAINLERENQVGAASSYSQLGILHRMLGDLDRAEEHLRQSLRIRESLNLPDVYKDYANLALVARDRGDTEAAAAWQAKRDAKVAELERLRRGDGDATAGFEQLAPAVLGLAQATYDARVHGNALPPEAAEAVAQLADLPPPLGAVGAFLGAVAGGRELPGVPEGLPEGMGEILEKLKEAVEKQGS